MPYVIVDRCTRDGSCVEVCPVACIHTTPAAPQYYIDPEICIECEQCVIVCPVEAIFLDIELPDQYLKAEEDNADSLLVIKGHPDLPGFYRANFLQHKAHSKAVESKPEPKLKAA